MDYPKWVDRLPWFSSCIKVLIKATQNVPILDGFVLASAFAQ